jgi:glycosyltransferase involved in cell wall biosynthesis
MSGSTQRITVVISTFNRALYLDHTLASLEGQDMPADQWAVLVVDNNSTDDTAAVVQRYRDRDVLPTIRYVCELEQGASFARRRGVAETDTELIGLIDDDVILEPDWVRHAVAFYDAHPRAGIVGGRIDLRWEEPPPEIALCRPVNFAQQNHGDTVVQLPGTGDAGLFGAGMVVRRTALEASGWLEKFILPCRKGTSLSTGGDMEIGYRIRGAGYELWYTPEMRLQHSIPPHRTTVQYLCRMNRANGHPFLILQALANGAAPPRFKRLITLVHTFLSFMKMLTWRFFWQVLVRREVSLDEWRIRLSLLFGHLEGAGRFVFRRIEI